VRPADAAVPPESGVLPPVELNKLAPPEAEVPPDTTLPPAAELLPIVALPPAAALPPD
jgi:hypothetical protein